MCTAAMQALLVAGLLWSARGHADDQEFAFESKAVKAESKEFAFEVGVLLCAALVLGVLIGVLLTLATRRAIDSKDDEASDDDAEGEEVDECKLPPPPVEDVRPPRKVYFTPKGKRGHTTLRCKHLAKTPRKDIRDIIWCKDCALGLFQLAVEYPEERGYFPSKPGA